MTRITKRSSCIAVALLLIADAVTIGSALGQQPEQTPMEGWDGRSAYALFGDRERGRQLAEACAACHGADGNSSDPKYPKLAGQAADYLDRELRAFKRGDRQSDVMAKIAVTLTDVDAVDLASFYSQQAIHADTIRDKSLADLGERIFSEGIDSSDVPACVTCHGAPGQPQVPIIGQERMGPGMMHETPMMEMMSSAANLNGQHAAYIIDQLNRFAARHREDLVMDRIAVRLGEADRKAVAEYVSGLQ
jgi:cytochrome c553